MDGSQIVRMILDLITTSPANTLKMKTKEPAWEEALVGFASGADSAFESFKGHVGPILTCWRRSWIMAPALLDFLNPEFPNPET